MVSLPLGVRRAYLLAHPAHIQHVLHEQPDHYRNGISVGRITPLFGEGLTTSEGVLWRRQRQLMQPVFQWQRLLPWTDVIAAATEAMLARWGPLAARGQPVELVAALRASVVPAEEYSRQALTLGEGLGMRLLVAHCHLGLGTLYAK